MAEIQSGLSLDQITSMIASAISGIPSIYVGGTDANPTTIANLIATYPPSAANLNKYARVTDLYGAVDDVMRCRWDGVNYRWVPQRESFSGTLAATSGAATLTPLVSAPFLRTTGTLLGNLSLSAAATNAYLGQSFVVSNNSTLGLFAMTITGLIGSNLTLLGNTTQRIVYGPSGWYAA